MNLISTVRGAMDERTKRELNYPHVQIGIIFIISFVMWVITLIIL